MRRLARILVCLAVVAAPLMVVAAVQPPAGGIGTYSNASIADTALRYVGQWGGNACRDAGRSGYTGGSPGGVQYDGQCRAFVNCIVRMASGRTQWLGGGGGDYFASFLSQGGQEISSIDQLQKGDIVQVGQGVHTFIIVGRVSGSTFTVVDSNHLNNDETVRTYNRPNVSLGTSAGVTTRAFRMGTVATGNPLAEGNFINLNGNIYRIAGGAPIYVQSWAAVGGPQAYSAVTQAQFDSLRQYPADGTVVAAAGFIYIFAGGAPVYLDSWDSVGGYRGQTIWVIDHAAIDAADGPWPWNHVRRYPADGTIVAAGGYIYVFAGGAPLYVNSWDNMGGYQGQTITTVALPALENITPSPPWNHVRYYPADGTIVAAGGYIHVFAGGAPLYVNSWDNMGGYQGQTITTVALPALENITPSPPWNHVRYYPADGTAVLAGVDAFIFAGGAPIYVGNWSAVGGERTTVRIAAPVPDNADGPPPWNHIRQYPADGTELRGGPAGAFYRVLAGVAEPVGSATSPTVVDQAAIDNAGAGGVWNHLKAPSPPAPVDEASVFVSGQITYEVLGPFTSGGFDVARNGNGTLHSIEGSGTFANGATFSAKASQFWILPIFVGSTRLTDTAAKLDLNTPVFLGNVSLSGGSVYATQGWFDLRTWPWKSYNLRWTIIDS